MITTFLLFILLLLTNVLVFPENRFHIFLEDV